MSAVVAPRVVPLGLVLLGLLGPAPAVAQGSIGLRPPARTTTVDKAGDPAAASAQAALDAARVGWEALPLADRIEVQSGLVWSGDYTGSLDGTFGRMTFEALTAFQARHRLAPDGLVGQPLRTALEEVAKKKREVVGWQMVADPVTGVRIGLPTRQVGPARKIDGGTQWSAKDGRVDIRAFTIADDDLPRLFERLKTVAPGRKVTYSVLRPDWFVVADTGAGKESYARFVRTASGIRGFVIVHDPVAMGPEFGRVVIATAGTFEPVAGTAPTASTTTPPTPAPTSPLGSPLQPTGPSGETPAPGPAKPPVTPPAPTSLAATGLVVAPGKVLTAILPGCTAPTVAGKPASVEKADAGGGLALLAAPGLTPSGSLVLADAALAAGSTVTVVSAAPALGATAGTLGERGVRAPLQRGGLGGVVLDASGRLVALVTAKPDESRRIMDLIPEATYAVAGPEAIASAATAAGASIEAKPAGAPQSSGAVVSALAPRVVPIACGK